jgi:hypothetical protein
MVVAVLLKVKTSDILVNLSLACAVFLSAIFANDDAFFLRIANYRDKDRKREREKGKIE